MVSSTNAETAGERFENCVVAAKPILRFNNGLSDFFIMGGSVCHEIGCSTGTLLF